MSNGQGYQQIETFPNIAIPGLSKIPLIGDAFFNCDFLTYILYVLLILTWIFYKKTNLGLSFMAVGEHPRAAESAGIQVKKYRWIVMAVSYTHLDVYKRQGNTVFIGDQLFTDIWGAKNAGLRNILVKPINPKEEKMCIRDSFLSHRDTE